MANNDLIHSASGNIYSFYTEPVRAEFRNLPGFGLKPITHDDLDLDIVQHPYRADFTEAYNLTELLYTSLLRNHHEVTNATRAALFEDERVGPILRGQAAGAIALTAAHVDLSDLPLLVASLEHAAHGQDIRPRRPLPTRTHTVVGYPMMSFALGFNGVKVDPVELLRSHGSVIKTYMDTPRYDPNDLLVPAIEALRSRVGRKVASIFSKQGGDVFVLAPTATRIRGSTLPKISIGTSSLFFNQNVTVVPVYLNAPVLGVNGLAPTDATIAYGEPIQYRATERGRASIVRSREVALALRDLAASTGHELDL